MPSAPWRRLLPHFRMGAGVAWCAYTLKGCLRCHFFIFFLLNYPRNLIKLLLNFICMDWLLPPALLFCVVCVLLPQFFFSRVLWWVLGFYDGTRSKLNYKRVVRY